MSKTKLNVLFKKMQRDDKKDLLKFEYTVSDDNKNEDPKILYTLAGELINFEIQGCEAGPLTAEFSNVNKDSKKISCDFVLKGDSEVKALELYKFAGKSVTLLIEPSQSSLVDNESDFDDHEGLEYTVDLGGSVNVVKNEDEAEYEVENEAPSNVADLEAERMKRAAGDDDDLPF